MIKIPDWLLASNRPQHLLCVFAVSLLLGWSGSVGAIVALEYKDVQHGGWPCWDWLDCLAGAIGGMIGGAVHWLIFKHW